LVRGYLLDGGGILAWSKASSTCDNKDSYYGTTSSELCNAFLGESVIGAGGYLKGSSRSLSFPN